MLRSFSVVSFLLFLVGFPYWGGGQSCCVVSWDFSILDLPSLFSLSLVLDPLRLGFGFVLGFVVSQVYCYSLGYMRGGPYLRGFFAPLSLFVGSMMLLVFGSDLMTVFLGWEGLGISSFLLVFFYNNNLAAGARIITVLRNRFGDAFFLFGMVFLVGFDYRCFLCHFSGGSGGWSCFFFVLSAFSKRAQWPLSAWLPAAMAAPTPISALVHSSTLVTAGVYLLLRVEGCSAPSYVSVFWVPCLTLFLASLRASLSHDLKRIVAMSTLGHLSIMLIAVMSGNLHLGVFHLITHALFKSLLFMGSGNAISFYGHSQDIRDMGRILKSLPLRRFAILCSLFSLGGVPFSSGFCSKDLILEYVSFSLGAARGFSAFLCVLSLSLSVFYCFRLWYHLMVSRGGVTLCQRTESNPSVGGPLLSLSVVSVVAGCVIDHFFYVGSGVFNRGWYWLSFFVLLGLFCRICYYSWGGGGGVYFIGDYPDYRADFHGPNNLCFIRAPYHLIRGSVLHSSLFYVKHVEHG